ncbi:MAG: hypothetical protein H7Y39_02220 [Nitrospiraceae bacterium]|nr:hypothetical protein [Nitrospiraceae bacterium]
MIGLVQMGVLELHAWGAKREALDRPDRIIMDLDPDPTGPRPTYAWAAAAARGATAIAAYSTRARAGAPLSVPLAWKELSNDIRSDHFTVANVAERLKGLKVDPWRKYFAPPDLLPRLEPAP